MENIHATCVDLNGAGVLIVGASGKGKSDLALRLIENKDAVLVSDDRTNLQIKDGFLTASCPKNIEGLLEVRGIGIIKRSFKIKTIVKLAVLAKEKSIIRYPDSMFFEFQGVRVPRIELNLLEPSAPDKVVVKLKTILEENALKS